MTRELIRPRRGGFLRPFGCAWFIREYLAGNGPYASKAIDSSTGACQADIFYDYKMALIRETAMDRAIRNEEKQAKKEKRPINPENIQTLADRYAHRMPYKSHGCRYHSFVVYFSMLQRLGWVEATGREEPSAFQDNYPSGQPRKYFRLTAAGIAAPGFSWANPQRSL
ncbi:MAG: hypothetical protein C4542_09050 [Dehalococcoidia bacterium]|nr:MAG: hypothetical protein C4542_09050 [Dehalococcoidia bacterium]